MTVAFIGCTISLHARDVVMVHQRPDVEKQKISTAQVPAESAESNKSNVAQEKQPETPGFKSILKNSMKAINPHKWKLLKIGGNLAEISGAVWITYYSKKTFLNLMDISFTTNDNDNNNDTFMKKIENLRHPTVYGPNKGTNKDCYPKKVSGVPFLAIIPLAVYLVYDGSYGIYKVIKNWNKGKPEVDAQEATTTEQPVQKQPAVELSAPHKSAPIPIDEPEQKPEVIYIDKSVQNEETIEQPQEEVEVEKNNDIEPITEEVVIDDDEGNSDD